MDFIFEISVKKLLSKDSVYIWGKFFVGQCNACRPFTKHRERIQKLVETGNLRHLYGNELLKACFDYDTAYWDLARRIISEKKKKVMKP